MHPKSPTIVWTACAVLIAAAAVASAQQQAQQRGRQPPSVAPDEPLTSRLQITSTAFPHNGSIPSKYTCDGQGVNPPLTFASVPLKAQSLVLIMDDPDVPRDLMPTGVFDHWLIWDLPADSQGFAEGAGKGGINGAGQAGYIGPCPPDREHRYFFKLFALDTKLTGAKIANKKDLESAMQGHILQRAELMGRYQRK
jgi:Raf kinase inhibitor-like YbhB/YbcL family protein